MVPPPRRLPQCRSDKPGSERSEDPDRLLAGERAPGSRAPLRPVLPALRRLLVVDTNRQNEPAAGRRMFQNVPRLSRVVRGGRRVCAGAERSQCAINGTGHTPWKRMDLRGHACESAYRMDARTKLTPGAEGSATWRHAAPHCATISRRRRGTKPMWWVRGLAGDPRSVSTLHPGTAGPRAALPISRRRRMMGTHRAGALVGP